MVELTVEVAVVDIDVVGLLVLVEVGDDVIGDQTLGGPLFVGELGDRV